MELLERFAQGDMNAFEELFRQFQRDVYGWIVRIVRDSGTAEDLTVDTFLRAYRARARFYPKRSFGAWLRRIATNLALDHLKRRRRETPLDDNFPATVTDSNPGVQRERRERIDRAFQEVVAEGATGGDVGACGRRALSRDRRGSGNSGCDGPRAPSRIAGVVVVCFRRARETAEAPTIKSVRWRSCLYRSSTSGYRWITP
jgi:hypothetical protein